VENAVPKAVTEPTAVDVKLDIALIVHVSAGPLGTNPALAMPTMLELSATVIIILVFLFI
jgi:hypothetical protein